MTDPEALMNLAVRAAHAAGALLQEAATGYRTSVEAKSSDTDMVTEMDRASEELVARTLLDARPDDSLLAEEGTGGSGTTGVRWVIDPLDGTTNYLYGIAEWTVSIAAEIEGEVAVGVVHHPALGETFTAVRGQGARCNGRPLHVEGADDLDTALVATGFSYDPDARRRQAGYLRRILPTVRDIRRSGAASLDLCRVAVGRADIYYEWGLKHWDWAAGSLIAAEAGAVVVKQDDNTMVAAAPHLYEPFLRLLDEARRED
ncbi:MAG TPA: inositol monophosphatase family protein [Acidimicrobiales bacterium]|nr:inositol monophosphatase family protein [Acidimicrobiales bacterium]